MSTHRVLGWWVLCCVASLGCFTPTDEHDAGPTPADDGGVVEVDSGTTDAGHIQINCEASADSGFYLWAYLIPAGCTHFKGNLDVIGIPGGELADSTTSNVSSLEEIEGDLVIEDVSMVGNLRGFGKLERVTDALAIQSTDLPSVSAVGRLKEVGSISLNLAYGLRDVELGALEVIHGDFSILNNAELESLAGLRRLRTIEGKLFLSRNPNLKSAALAAFTSRVVIDGGVERR
jgi:hypothetical protein